MTKGHRSQLCYLTASPGAVSADKALLLINSFSGPRRPAVAYFHAGLRRNTFLCMSGRCGGGGYGSQHPGERTDSVVLASFHHLVPHYRRKLCQYVLSGDGQHSGRRNNGSGYKLLDIARIIVVYQEVKDWRTGCPYCIRLCCGTTSRKNWSISRGCPPAAFPERQSVDGSPHSQRKTVASPGHCPTAGTSSYRSCPAVAMMRTSKGRKQVPKVFSVGCPEAVNQEPLNLRRQVFGAVNEQRVP